MFGYNNKICFLDVSTGRIKEKELGEEFCRKWIGCEGFGTKLLLDNLKKGAKPLSKDNLLILVPGALVGTPFLTANKLGVFALSPLTGFLGEGFIGGWFAYELKRAGYDAVVISGKAKDKIWIKFSNGGIQIETAEKLWEKDTHETEEKLKEHGEVLSIGQAGENQVYFSSLHHRGHKAVGRTGLGAVAGSKNIKAFVASGKDEIKISKPKQFLALNKKLFKLALGPTTEKYRNFGTCGSVDAYYKEGIMPTKNWTGVTIKGWEGLTAKHFTKLLVKSESCISCPIACRKMCKFDSKTSSADYEVMYGIGFNIGITDAKKVLRLKRMCDAFGMDVISGGGAIALLMDLYERGKTKEKAKFGSLEDSERILRKLALREGIGDKLAEGATRFARKHGFLDYVSSNKNMCLPGFEIRGLHSAALAFCTSARGGCHLRAGAYDLDIRAKNERYRLGYSSDRINNIIKLEDFYCLIDSFGVCKFARKILDVKTLTKAWNLITGFNVSEKEVWKAGDGICTSGHEFNLKRGWKVKDDYPTPKLFKQQVKDGKVKGAILDKKQFKRMLLYYFKKRGWKINHKE